MIIPSYDPKFDFDDKGLGHSYQIDPPNYSSPQILYTFYYEGFMDKKHGFKYYNWSVQHPFYIISGQNTNTVTLQLMPILIKDREPMSGDTRIQYRALKYRDLNLDINGLKESMNLYYRQGPLWKIEGNRNPKMSINKSIETYTLIPQYDQTGHPPKNMTNPETYSFKVKNGTVIKFYGTNPPQGYPKVDILWHTSGHGYISFYSAWINESVKFPNTLDIFVS